MAIADKFRRSENPAERVIRWKGGENGGGKFIMWDKEKEEEVEVPMPFSFIVLQELSSITGYSKKNKTGIYSNEVQSIQHENLVVKYAKGGLIASGNYHDIKNEVKAAGGKYSKVLYCLMNEKMIRIVFSGAAVSAWIDACKEKKSDKYRAVSAQKEESGTVNYFCPVFEADELTEDEGTEAGKIYEEVLQPFLDNRSRQNQQERDYPVEEVFETMEHGEHVADDELPF